MALFLTEQDVTKIVTMPDAIRVVDQAFAAYGQGEAINRPRQRVRMPNGILHVMPAGWPRQNVFGFKYYSSFRGQTRFWVHLLGGENGNILAIIQADRLGQQRTGAASGVATKYLSLEDATSIGIIGTGWQAESQLEAVHFVRRDSVRVVRAYGRDPDRRSTFAARMSRILGMQVDPAESGEEAVRGLDIVITATSSREPVLKVEWLSRGMHINAVGSNRAESRELDESAVAKADLICVDSLEQSKIESGDLISVVEKGNLSWDRVVSLGAIVAGQVPGRKSKDQITLFKSNGIAIEDIALADWVYRQALSRGMGQKIEL